MIRLFVLCSFYVLVTIEINFIALFILIKELQNTLPEVSKMAAEHQDLLLEGL